MGLLGYVCLFVWVDVDFEFVGGCGWVVVWVLVVLVGLVLVWVYDCGLCLGGLDFGVVLWVWVLDVWMWCGFAIFCFMFCLFGVWLFLFGFLGGLFVCLFKVL